jgi:hypothetical protein
VANCGDLSSHPRHTLSYLRAQRRCTIKQKTVPSIRPVRRSNTVQLTLRTTVHWHRFTRTLNTMVLGRGYPSSKSRDRPCLHCQPSCPMSRLTSPGVQPVETPKQTSKTLSILHCSDQHRPSINKCGILAISIDAEITCSGCKVAL